MARVRSRGTVPEALLKKALRKAGLQFKTNDRNLPGKPDIVLPGKKVAVFVDGDFWHGRQWQKRGLASIDAQFCRTRSKKYWLGKIRRNMHRDCVATSSLLARGWKVLRIWESDIRANLNRCANMTLEILKKKKANPYSILTQKTCAEFFAGIGLMRMGLEQQGWRVRFANDNDPQKFEMYRGQFDVSDGHFRYGDIHQLKSVDIPTVSLATASFPCNDLSLAGARKGLDGKHSSTFWRFVLLLQNMRERRPPLLLIENVTGFLTSHAGKDLEEALLALNSLGYSVDAFILDAARFVPQSRQRLFVVGILDPLRNSQKPEPLTPRLESDVRPESLTEFIESHPRIDWRIRALPQQPKSTMTLDDVIEPLPDDDPMWWSPERTEYLLNQMSPRHRKLAATMIRQPKFSYGTVFRRVRKEKSMAELRTDGIAGCLRTPRGGSGRQILVKAGKGQFSARLLSARECARLMGADNFRMSVPLNQALFGFGDAVCVPAISWITQYYLNPVVNELTRGVILGPLSKARTA